MADDGSVHVVSRTLPVEGGALAKAASQAKPAKVSPLAGLPQSPFFVAGGGVFCLSQAAVIKRVKPASPATTHLNDRLEDIGADGLDVMTAPAMGGLAMPCCFDLER